MRDFFSRSLATVALVAATVSAGIQPMTKPILDNRDYALTRNVSFTPELTTNSSQEHIGACHRACQPPCVAFRYNRTTLECLTVTCSGLAYKEKQPLTFLRALDGIVAKTTSNDTVMRKMIDINANCISLDMYQNYTGLASVLYFKEMDDGTSFFSTNMKFDKGGVEIGRMVYSDYSNKDKKETISKACPDSDCLYNLCREKVSNMVKYAYKLSLRTDYCLGKPNVIDGSTIGMVAKRACCGATIPIWEHTNGDYYYYTDSPTYEEKYESSKEPVFFLWESQPKAPGA